MKGPLRLEEGRISAKKRGFFTQIVVVGLDLGK